MKYCLFSSDSEQAIKWFDKFDKIAILNEIKAHLLSNPNDTIEYCKEYNKRDIKKYYGMEIIDIYGNNPKTLKPCKLVFKGDKTYYKLLN